MYGTLHYLNFEASNKNKNTMKTQIHNSALKSILLVIAISLAGCSAMYKRHDVYNPCSYNNNFECATWQSKYPKEYERYQARMKKFNEVNSEEMVVARTFESSNK
jgi:hypothetical protein